MGPFGRRNGPFPARCPEHKRLHRRRALLRAYIASAMKIAGELHLELAKSVLNDAGNLVD